MKHSIRLRWVYQFQLEEGRIWMDETFGADAWEWRTSMGGTFHINFDKEEDKCIFILRYGDFIA